MAKLHSNDIDLYYEITGQGDPLVLIHGLGSSTQDWAFQVEEFSKHYRVITFDVRGHGQSDKPPGPYGVELFARDTAGLIGALEAAPAHVIGISMGGMIAFQLAVDRPDLVKSLVIVNSYPELVPRSLKDRLQVVQRFLIVKLLGMRKMGEVLAGRLFPKPEHAALRELFADHWAQNDPKAYQETMKALVGWSVTERLGEIEAPTLVVAADQDYTPLADKEAYTARLKHAELVVVEDSRHATPVEHPDTFNRILAAFLEKVSG